MGLGAGQRREIPDHARRDQQRARRRVRPAEFAGEGNETQHHTHGSEDDFTEAAIALG
jgi:hypothetical protein